MKNLKTDVVIIGGGAAGMMAASVAAGRGLEVLLLEPNRYMGKKLRITGKGRCNITNNCDAREFIGNVTRNGKFLQGAVNSFSPYDAMEFFESAGVPLKTERGARVFPVSDKAGDVADALERRMISLGVKILRRSAERINIVSGAVNSVIAGDYEIACSSVAVCTGGLSYPGTGSTGDGYRIALEAGHSVTELLPSLVPLISDPGYPELEGLSLRNVRLTVFDAEEKTVFSELGEMLFTDYGISGPLALSASAHMRNFSGGGYGASIDLKPGLDEYTLDQRLLRDFEKYVNKEFKNSLSDLCARKMIPVIVGRSGIDPEKRVNSVTREERRRLSALLKDFRMSITGTRPVAEAVVTSGGVETREIDPKTMQSKIVGGLFFAGEIIDVDAYTGGFNLQIAWSTGYACGRSVF